MANYIGVDLGTANTLVYLKGKGIVLEEPSVVALERAGGRVLAVGQKAKDMLGRAPKEVAVVRPLKEGVIADFDVTQAMLKAFLEKACRGTVSRPSVTVCVPFGVTEVERRAVLEAILRSGGKSASVLEEPMAAALGAELPVEEATGSMVVDIGGGTCEVAVVALGGIVASTSLRCAGDQMDEDIISFIKVNYGVLIGAPTAEAVKIAIGTAHHSCEEKTMAVMGRDMYSGLPKEVTLTSKEVRTAMSGTLMRIAEAVRTTLEETPPELSADVVRSGIHLTGGGANLPGLHLLISEQTGICAYVSENAQRCVARGAGIAMAQRYGAKRQGEKKRLFRRK